MHVDFVVRCAVFGLMAALSCACGSNGDDDNDSNAQGGSSAGGSSSGGSGSLAGYLACPTGTRFHLSGELDGQAIEISEAPTLGGFAQSSSAPGSHFRLPNEGDDEPASLIVVSFTWDGVSSDGMVTPIEGWVRLPTGVPFEGETVCAGAGSQMVIPPNDIEDTQGDFVFRMRELARGVSCDTPLAGQLDGCWNNSL